MKLKRFTFCVLILLFATTHSFAQLVSSNVKKVAILETVDKEGKIDYGVKLMLRSSMAEAITNTPGYEAYDRVDVASIMGEQSFQRTGMVSNEQIKKLGEMTGADYILVAEAAILDNEHLLITAKIIEVETAKLIRTSFARPSMVSYEFEAACRDLAYRLLGIESPVSQNITANSQGSSKSKSSTAPASTNRAPQVVQSVNAATQGTPVNLSQLNFLVADQDEFYRNSNEISWFDALRIAEERGTGWRLPTRQELYYMSSFLDALGMDRKGKYWSSESKNKGNAYYYDFYEKEYDDDDKKDADKLVRLVKDKF